MVIDICFNCGALQEWADERSRTKIITNNPNMKKKKTLCIPLICILPFGFEVVIDIGCHNEHTKRLSMAIIMS